MTPSNNARRPSAAARRRRVVRLPWLLLACVALQACGGAATEGAAEPATAGKKPANPADCEAYAGRLCETLGTRTEGCAAAAQVATWMPPKACTAALQGIDYSLAQIAEQREHCSEFANRVCAEFGSDSEPCLRVRADMKEIPPGSCAALLARFPQLMTQLRALVARDQPLSDGQQAQLLEGDPPSFGKPGAGVTIVEFSDFQCPYCSMAAQTVHRIREKYGEQVHFVFRQFPLSFHDNAQLAAEASLAAHAQGRFWALHDAMFAHQDALGRADLERYAEEAGLDVDAFKQALDDGSARATVESDLALGAEVQITGTPTMFINGERVENPTDYEAVEARLDALLSE